MADYSKPDHWSQKAQKEGYPARSVYKLKEMDQKFSLFKNKRSPFRVLDLGAAPGSWSLYLLRKIPLKAGVIKTSDAEQATPTLVSVDLIPLSRQYDEGLFDRPDFLFLRGDFTSSEIREAIVSHGPYNLVVSDAAPSTTGNRSVDTLRSLDLAEAVLNYAETSLVKGGNMAVKVFQGGDTGKLLKAIRSLFETGKSFKPQACRSGSFETYYLGLGRKVSTLNKYIEFDE
jgi:23S rRNA (uridine2552-2'-O)-methyltransferase